MAKIKGQYLKAQLFCTQKQKSELSLRFCLVDSRTPQHRKINRHERNTILLKKKLHYLSLGD